MLELKHNEILKEMKDKKFEILALEEVNENMHSYIEELKGIPFGYRDELVCYYCFNNSKIAAELRKRVPKLDCKKA